MLHTTLAAKVAKTQHQDSAINQSTMNKYSIFCLLLMKRPTFVVLLRVCFTSTTFRQINVTMNYKYANSVSFDNDNTIRADDVIPHQRIYISLKHV